MSSTLSSIPAPALPPDPFLTVANLSVTLRAKVPRRLVDEISFTIGPGEIIGLVGESGSGKTISLLAMLGLIDNPNLLIAGSVLYKNQQLIGLAPKAFRKIRGPEIAMIFQDAATALTPVIKIGAQIVEQIRAHKPLSRSQATARAIDLLHKMGFPDPAAIADRYPHELSGGQRQRAMIAMALSCNPSLLIADEPTTALDMTIQAQILDLIGKLRNEFDASIVIVTHDMGVVAEQADKVIVLYAGQVVETGDKHELFRHPRHPYTQGLLAAIPPIDGPRPRRLAQIPGEPPSSAANVTACPFAPRCPNRFSPCDEKPPLYRTATGAAACHLLAPIYQRHP